MSLKILSKDPKNAMNTSLLHDLENKRSASMFGAFGSNCDLRQRSHRVVSLQQCCMMHRLLEGATSPAIVHGALLTLVALARFRECTSFC